MTEATPKQKKIARKYFKAYEIVANPYWKEVSGLEALMSKEMGIPDTEFIFCDNELAGIGNVGRTMKLIRYH
jgi:hypothetical protein